MLDPDAGSCRRLESRLRLAKFGAQDRDPGAARRTLQQVLEIAPDAPRARTMLLDPGPDPR